MSSKSLQNIDATEEPKSPNVLFVDDEQSNRQAFKASFRTKMNVLVAGSATEALAMLDRNSVHVIISDQRMPGIAGNDLLGMVKERFPMVRRMLMTAYTDVEAIIDAINTAGVMHYISKPWDPNQVGQLIKTAFDEHRREQDENERTTQLEVANRQLEFALRQQLLS